MKELIESKWQEILNILVKEHEISEVAVNTWIQFRQLQMTVLLFLWYVDHEELNL